MDTDALQHAIEHAGLVALGAGFLAGLVFSFNPVALASIPVSMAYVTKARSTQRSAVFGASFTVAMILVQTLLGFVAGFGGSWVESLLGRQWGLLLGPVLIVLGLMWPGWVRILAGPRHPDRTRRMGGRVAGESQLPKQISKRLRDRRSRDADCIRTLHAECVLLLDTRTSDLSQFQG